MKAFGNVSTKLRIMYRCDWFCKLLCEQIEDIEIVVTSGAYQDQNTKLQLLGRSDKLKVSQLYFTVIFWYSRCTSITRVNYFPSRAHVVFFPVSSHINASVLRARKYGAYFCTNKQFSNVIQALRSFSLDDNAAAIPCAANKSQDFTAGVRAVMV